MPFDWTAYRVVAETLKENGDEASHHTAISRAYYYAYHQALNHLAEHHGFQHSEARPAHDQVWREFDHKGMTYQEVRRKGNSLKQLRVDADYHTNALISAELATTSLKVADRIVECLNQLHNALQSRQS